MDEKKNNEEELLLCHCFICTRFYRERESDAHSPELYCSRGCECQQIAYGN